jgi:hypothetical protein
MSTPHARPGFRSLACLGAVLLVLALPLPAQVSDKPAADAGPLRVFVEGFDRAPTALAADVPYVQFVADRARAQVLVTVDPERMRFTGLGELGLQQAEYPLRPDPGEPPDAFQARILQTLRLGLLRYVSKSPAAGRIGVRLLDEVKPTSVVDPWHFWVFSLSGNAFLNGQEAYSMDSLFGSLSAQRVTPDWKIQLGASLSRSKNRYHYQDYDYASESNSAGFNGLLAKGLGEHWSAGLYLKISRSTFDNTRWSVIPRPALEYDVYPYSESTKRQLRIIYTVGPTFVRYDEVTIYDKLRETLLGQSLGATLELKQPWGDVEASLTGQHYFHDLSKYRIELEASLEVRLFKGFNLELSGSGSRIHDQVALAKGGATYEEVLLQRKQLATGYDYSFSVGFSYRFGSIFSNVINPRFGSGDGGMSISISM